jgi:dihydrofolate synthase/folylpolyglutamate synthase
MGGRLDATNVLSPEVSVITRIGLEHTNYLGSTIRDIAREKAGIIKAGVPVVTCERNPEALEVISNICRKKGSRLLRIDEDFSIETVRESLTGTEFEYVGGQRARMRTRLLGMYQAENAAAALATVETLHDRGIHVTKEEMSDGVQDTRWPGRLDLVSRNPLVVFDGSHNPDGVSATARVLSGLGVVPLTFVIGCMDDKDAVGIVRALGPISARMICTQAEYKRALPARRLAEIARQEYDGPVEVEESSVSAFEAGFRSEMGKGMCVIGSLYLVGEAIRWWANREPVQRASHKL